GNIINGEPALDNTDNTILCAIILAKLLATTHSNVVATANEEDAQLLWKAIMKRFISSKPSNRSRVYNIFTSIEFDPSNIEKFITEVRSALVKMEDVGIKMEPNILTYDLLIRLPRSLDNIKNSITHSQNGEKIRPETRLDHLEIHINKIKVSTKSKIKSTSTTKFTKEESRCRKGFHNPKATHPKHRCWFLYPHLNLYTQEKAQDNNFSSFSTFSLSQPSIFIIDSGSTFHKVSKKDLFSNLDESK
ncbi:hypothetical protein VP01_7300g1, partial [Puccinia sorghi]